MKKRGRNGAIAILGRIGSPILHRHTLHKSLDCNRRNVPAQPSSISADTEFKELSIHFPIGAVINLRFRRAASKDQPQVRSEDRYDLTDINLRLEFVDLGPEAIRALEKEFLALSAPQHPRRK
jgi:hypothetical protein